MSKEEIPSMREGSALQKTFLEEVIPSGTQGMHNDSQGKAEEAASVFLAVGAA